MFDVVDARLDERVDNPMRKRVYRDPSPGLVNCADGVNEDSRIPQGHEVRVRSPAAVDPVADDLDPAVGRTRHGSQHARKLALVLDIEREVAHVALRARNVAAAADEVQAGFVSCR